MLTGEIAKMLFDGSGNINRGLLMLGGLEFADTPDKQQAVDKLTKEFNDWYDRAGEFIVNEIKGG